MRNVVAETHSLSAQLTKIGTDKCWWITSVYGPQAEQDKIAFLQELRTFRQQHIGPWMVCGDFNLIYKAAEKNNNLLNRRMMVHFRNFLNTLELKELQLHGRAFTWSNEQRNPTLTYIDRVFIMMDWELLYPNCSLRGLSTNCSDHYPLLLCINASFIFRKRFQCEKI